jgi:beta-D-galactosyl-(1->4)-L-rhamnose phosphorylase
MTDDSLNHGDFTLPGEAGFEDLTLRLAKKWGADTIRDSDGTDISPEITRAGYDIYSTLCLVRSVSAWATKNPDKLQQSFLMSIPVVAQKPTVTIDPIDGYFREQFVVNTKDDPKRWWQVFDRTTGREVPKRDWDFNRNTRRVSIRKATRWHRYTVNFLAYRIWEEISMYNQITNGWADREHKAAVDPMYPETQTILLKYLEQWLDEHPETAVVRFTSMFYNFTWFWGKDPNNRYLYSDWGDYAMTVSPRALRLFQKKYGYALTSEDFVNGGLYNSNHNTPSRRYRDYMDFLHRFVVEFGRECVKRVHARGKKAYVFYDDHWIGVEPYSERFKDFGFDGLIKCVFNAFEVRKCSHARGVKTRELRLHPYLFPTGLKGEPTFQEGGNPTLDAKNFWIDARRGILRAPIDRIGLGGRLSLVEPFPDFSDTIEQLAREFRLLKSFHAGDKPVTAPFKVGILHAWGSLRSWICSGHFVRGLDLNELLESLAGLPFEVEFFSFEDLIEKGVPRGVGVVINCGHAGSAWSGGCHWENPAVVEALTGWVAKGGSLLGVADPSATPTRAGSFFQMAPVLGIDREQGERIANGKYRYLVQKKHFITKDLPELPDFGKHREGVYVLDGETSVLAEQREGGPAISIRSFGKGRAVYFSGFHFAPENTRLLHRALYWAAAREEDYAAWSSSNVRTECAWFPRKKKLVVINNDGRGQETVVTLGDGRKTKSVRLEAHGIAIFDLPR